MDPYVYTATVVSVYDGDTITCTVRCGFGVELIKQKIRLYGLNSPEVRGESREQGLVARDKLREKILGKDFFVWGTSLFIKEPGDKTFVSWHQDSTYWGLSSPDVVTAWVALSPATSRSGCMKMIPKSHKWGQLKHKDTFKNKNLLTRGQEITSEFDKSCSKLVRLKPGQMSLHNIGTVHASGPNLSNERRIGIAVRYIATHVKQKVFNKDSAWQAIKKSRRMRRTIYIIRNF